MQDRDVIQSNSDVDLPELEKVDYFQEQDTLSVLEKNPEEESSENPLDVLYKILASHKCTVEWEWTKNLEKIEWIYWNWNVSILEGLISVKNKKRICLEDDEDAAT